MALCNVNVLYATIFLNLLISYFSCYADNFMCGMVWRVLCIGLCRPYRLCSWDANK